MFMRFRTTSLLGLSLIWLMLVSGDGRAQNSAPTEYQIKAAFLFNFARFIQWPPKALAEATSPLVIGVLGENPFHDDLERTMRGKSVDEHPLVVKEFHALAEATNCQILFISTSEKTRLPQILKSIKGSSVLTVGEMDHFTETGGMINFVMEGAKIRFQINNDAAANEGLKISSKLLALAFHPEH
jgi:hypothetical protein